MQYFISFLEGILTFISPCLLPMLPIYVSYFAGGGERSTGKTLKTALGFVLGFTVVFVAMGALAGTLGGLLRRYQTAVNIISGGVVILFGLSYLGVVKLNFFKGSSKALKGELGFFSALLFGIVIQSLKYDFCRIRAGIGADARTDNLAGGAAHHHQRAGLQLCLLPQFFHHGSRLLI